MKATPLTTAATTRRGLDPLPLWHPTDQRLARQVAAWVVERPMRLFELARVLGVSSELVDAVVERNPCAFSRRDGADGVERIALRPVAGPEAVLERRDAMRHFARVAPKPRPYARAWLKPRPGWCDSCGDPLRHPDATGWREACEAASRLLAEERNE